MAAQPTISKSFRFDLALPFDLAAVLRTHGWVELAPWSWDGTTLARRERFGDAAGTLAIRQPAPTRVIATWRADTAAAPSPTRAALAAAVGRALSWDWDAAPFLTIAAALDPRAHALVARGAGRLLRGTTFYEDFAKTVC